MELIDTLPLNTLLPNPQGTGLLHGEEQYYLNQTLPVYGNVKPASPFEIGSVKSLLTPDLIEPSRKENSFNSDRFDITGMAVDAPLGDLHSDRPTAPATIASAIARRAGQVENQANFAAQADFARPLFDVDGSGVTIGVISGSYNFLGGASADIASHDLPANVTVLKEGAPLNGENPDDEGRAMMQLIHDIAIGARLLFYTAGNNEAELATAIRALANAGANIIVDDIVFTNQPFFQDGLAAQAVNEVVNRGVAYFSAAGNDGRNAYQSNFRDSGISFSSGQLPVNSFGGVFPSGFYGGTAHDFDPGLGIDIFQRFTLGPGDRFQVNFQWDQPFASVSPGRGAANDIDIYVLNAAQNIVVGGSAVDNIGGDPIEQFVFENTTGSTAEFNFLILRNQGDAPGLMRSLFFQDAPAIQEFATNSPTLYGHANAALSMSVGAADYRTPTVLEPFSSSGPTPILFDVAGNRLPVPEIRQQPRIVAPDNTNTTFFIPGQDAEGDRFPNFPGTSAAAPNAAGVAALMLQVAPGTTPRDLYQTLERTAIDLGTPGVDFDSGYGLIQADRAVGVLRLFDANYYLTQYPDVAQAVNRGAFRSGLDHFLQFGQFEGRNPSARFNNSNYLAQNPDVADAVNRGALRSGFQHFILYGQIEGRDRTTLFDPSFYLAQNPDVPQAVTNGTFRSAYEHFMEFGQAERRNPNAFFNANFYLTQNPDVATAVTQGAFSTAYEHFLKFGQAEGRDPSLLFNTRVYLARNPDVAQAVTNGVFRSAFEHFFLFGRAEGRVAV